jgi:hypothetical protein
MLELEPKREYANWLHENGEPAKAVFMERFITALASLSESDLPDFESVDNCWSRMVGGDTLRMLVKSSQDLELAQRKPLRDIVFRYLEPSIVVRYCKEEHAYGDFTPDPHSSHYFLAILISVTTLLGQPSRTVCMISRIPTGVISPNSPCLFACQVRSKDLALFVAADLLASDEMLSFFTFVETNAWKCG